ncbi:MAG: hypothetical protein ACLQBX_02290 [Candidatus Limnocylindrales bacterium]|jgi:hypothetical protein
MGDPIGAAVDVLHNIFVWFQTVIPGGFGLLLIPFGILAIISLLAARRA